MNSTALSAQQLLTLPARFPRGGARPPARPDWLLAIRRCPESCLSPAARACKRTPQAPSTQPEPIASTQHRSPPQAAAAAARASQRRTGVVHSYRSVRLAVSSPELPKHRCRISQCAISTIRPFTIPFINILSLNSETSLHKPTDNVECELFSSLLDLIACVERCQR